MATGYQITKYSFGRVVWKTYNPSGFLFKRWAPTDAYTCMMCGTGYPTYQEDIIEVVSYGAHVYSLKGDVAEGYRTSGSNMYSIYEDTEPGSSNADCSIGPFTYYNLALTAGYGGSVSYSLKSGSAEASSGAAGTYKIDSGSVATITAKPNTDYAFSSWSDGNTSASRQVTMNSDKTLTASFVYKPLLTVTSQDTSQGTASCSTAGRVEPNTQHTLTATPKTDYKFIGWYVNGSLVTVDNPANITVGQTDVTYQARFASTYHTVNVVVSPSSDPGSGAVEMYVDGVQKESGTSVKEGSSVRIVATPSKNYLFSHWIVGGLNIYEADHTFILPESAGATYTCTAVFVERSTYDVHISKENNALGTVTLTDGDTTWNETDHVISIDGHGGIRYTATAAVVSSLSPNGRELNQFSGWYVDGVKVSSQTTYSFVRGTGQQGEVIEGVNLVARFEPKRLYHAEISIPVGAGGTAVIEPQPDVTSPNDRWLEGTITAVATPNVGYYVGSFNVSDIDYGSGGHVVSPQKDSDGKYRDSFTLNYNARITVNFLKIPCRVYVRLDAASAAASAGLATVRSTAQGGSTDGMVYGDTAIYEATPNLGFQFGGWYLENGDSAPDSRVVVDGVEHIYSYTDAEYRTVLTGDLRLVAKFKASVTIGLSATQSAHGTVTLDDQTTTTTPLQKWVTLGDTIHITATPQTAGVDFFGSWFAADDTDFLHPLDLSADETVVVRGTISYVARFISSEDALYVALCSIDNDTGSGDATLGNLIMLTSGATPVEVSECSADEYLSRTGLNALPDGWSKLYKLTGTSRVTLTASPAAGRGFIRWTKEYVESGVPAGESDLTDVASSSIVVNRSFIYRAYWGDPKPARIVLNFADGSTVVNGGLKIDGIEVADDTIQDKIETETETSATYTQNDIVRISVDIKNGYLFAGWFYDPGCTTPVRDSVVGDVTYTHLDAEYVFKVGSPVTICAKFVEDVDAIYRWEGSDERKMMRWVSKTYASNRPFDPSCLRVDALKYPVDVRVGMFSSPDGVAAKEKRVTVATDAPRRLKLLRPERFASVELRSDGEIDAVYVSTSMGGLLL